MGGPANTCSDVLNLAYICITCTDHFLPVRKLDLDLDLYVVEKTHCRFSHAVPSNINGSSIVMIFWTAPHNTYTMFEFLEDFEACCLLVIFCSTHVRTKERVIEKSL